MASDIRQARLTVAASFLPHFFLENLAIRYDNSILVTVATRKELWYVPPPREGAQVDPMLLHTFDEMATGIVDVTMLLGWFTGVSLTLAAFDVPSNAIGLKQ